MSKDRKSLSQHFTTQPGLSRLDAVRGGGEERSKLYLGSTAASTAAANEEMRQTRKSWQGIFALYKPKGLSSHDAVEQVRKITGVQRVGHAGTLDPLAQGVLVIGIGREYTKQLNSVVQKEKEYIAQVRLGVTSTTDDAEGTKIQTAAPRIPSRLEVERALAAFCGNIMQRPPVFSAVKVGGREAYKYARRGEEIALQPRPVTVKSIEIIRYRWPSLTLKLVTGPGVYIRSIARDLGEALGIGGYLASLERTRVGDFTKDKALKLAELEELVQDKSV